MAARLQLADVAFTIDVSGMRGRLSAEKKLARLIVVQIVFGYVVLLCLNCVREHLEGKFVDADLGSQRSEVLVVAVGQQLVKTGASLEDL